jgi:hypothetical protein
MTKDGTRRSALEESPISIADATSTEAEAGFSSQIETPGSSLNNHDHETTTALPLSKLCSKCRNIFDHWDQIPYIELWPIGRPNDEAASGGSSLQTKIATFSHHNTLLELESSAKEGCTLCRQFVKDDRILEACRQRIQGLPRIYPNGKFVGQVEVGLVPDDELDNCRGLVWNIVPSIVDSDGPKLYQGYNSRYSTANDYLEVCIIPIPEPGKLLSRGHTHT